MQPSQYGTALGVLVLIAVEHETLFGLHRTALANALVGISGVGNLVIAAQVAEQHRAFVIDHDTQCAFFALLQQQHDRLAEVRVLQLRNRDQETRCERSVHTPTSCTEKA